MNAQLKQLFYFHMKIIIKGDMSDLFISYLSDIY